MPEQPQWSERTLDMPPQDPWADQPTAQATPPTTPFDAQRPAPHPGGPHGAVQQPPAQVPDQSPFSRGRAQVTPRTQQYSAGHEPTGTGWPEEPGRPHREPRSLSWHIRRLRRGSEWSNAALIFAFVCWGIWVLSTEGSFATAAIIFVVTVCVAAGVFALSRLVGRLVLERQMGRVRHSARGSHMVAGLFLVGVGITQLRQVEWVMDAFQGVVSLFN
ncbi:DNA-directed RNA polymerase II [Actinoplanes sp. NPDC051861]|uniref:DNA-directed RNA polymerase II n=1 Tax=Actinoplanes sp. NPDC051861 TaxID=3155170 RepID=UPI003422DC36